MKQKDLTGSRHSRERVGGVGLEAVITVQNRDNWALST